jgi:hypothetical protein
MLAGLGVVFLLTLADLGGAVFAHASQPWWSLLLKLAELGVALSLVLAGLGGAVFAHASWAWCSSLHMLDRLGVVFWSCWPASVDLFLIMRAVLGAAFCSCWAGL